MAETWNDFFLKTSTTGYTYGSGWYDTEDIPYSSQTSQTYLGIVVPTTPYAIYTISVQKTRDEINKIGSIVDPARKEFEAEGYYQAFTAYYKSAKKYLSRVLDKAPPDENSSRSTIQKYQAYLNAADLLERLNNYFGNIVDTTQWTKPTRSDRIQELATLIGAQQYYEYEGEIYYAWDIQGDRNPVPVANLDRAQLISLATVLIDSEDESQVAAAPGTGLDAGTEGGVGGGGGGGTQVITPIPAAVLPNGASEDLAAAEAAAAAAAQRLRDRSQLSDEAELFLALPMLASFNRKCSIRTYSDGIIRSSFGKVLKGDTSWRAKKIDNLATIKDSQMSLFYLKQEALSTFIPTIEIAKVILNKERKAEKIVRIDFPRSMDPKQDTLLNYQGRIERTFQQSSQNILYKRNQIGIKSFNWRLDNTNQEMSGKFVSAELELVMDSVDALFAERQGIKNSYKVGDQDSGYQNVNYRISDLLIQPDCLNSFTDTSTIASNPNIDTSNQWISPVTTTPWIPECYEILVTVGNSCDEFTLKGLSSLSGLTSLGQLSYASEADLSIGDFDAFKTTLYLTVNKHEFDFEETGKAVVKIYYQGRMETTLKSSENSINIPEQDETIELKEGSGFKEKYLENKSKIINVLTEDKIVATINNNAILLSIAKRFGLVENEKYSVNALQFSGIKELYVFAGQIAEILEKSKDKRAEDFVKRLKEAIKALSKTYSGIYFQAVANTLIGNKLKYFYSPSNVKDYVSGTLNVDIGAISTEELITKVNTALSTNHNSIYGGESSYGGEAAKNHGVRYDSNSKDNGASPWRLGSSEEPYNGLPLDATPFMGRGVSGSAGVVEYYVLSDILNAMIVRTAKPPFSSFRGTKIVLGSIALPHPENPGKYVFSDLGDIPIPVKMFNEFVTNQSKTEKPIYTFNSMLNDFINQVVKNVLNPTFKNEKIPYSFNIKTYNLSLFNITAADSIFNDATYDANMIQLFNKGNTIENFYSPKRGTPMEVLYLYVQGQTQYENYSSGDLNTDYTNKIPHLRYNNSFGIFKSVKFAKEDMPYLPEARATSFGGSSNIGQFTGMYKANIEAFGNNLLKNGDLVYIDARTLGRELGNPLDSKSLSWLMGLGGLYMIIKTDHNLSPEKYSTTYEARFVSRTTKGTQDGQDVFGQINIDLSSFGDEQTGETSSVPTVDTSG